MVTKLLFSFYLTQQTDAPMFDVEFIYYGQKGEKGRLAMTDCWQIRIYKLQPVRLFNVYIRTNGYTTNFFEKAEWFYPILESGSLVFYVEQIHNRTLIVDIIWDSGQEGFYCNPWETE